MSFARVMILTLQSLRGWRSAAGRHHRHELLDPLPVVDFASEDVPHRVDPDRIGEVHLPGQPAVLAEVAEQFLGATLDPRVSCEELLGDVWRQLNGVRPRANVLGSRAG